MSPSILSPARRRRRFTSRIGACLLTSLLLLASAHAEPRDSDGQFSNVSLHDDGRPGISYALIRTGNGTVFSGHSNELKQARAYGRRHEGNYLWFRDGTKHYVIDDAASVAKLTELWQATAPVEQQLEPLEAEMEGYARDMEDLSAERDDLRDDRHERNGDTDYRAQMDRLDESSAALSNKMELLGDRIEALGEQIEQLSRAADEQTLTLIREARSNGMAKPVEL